MAPDLIRRRRALREGAAVGLGSQSLDKYGPESDHVMLMRLFADNGDDDKVNGPFTHMSTMHCFGCGD